jgi:hypothetical protein
MNNPMINPMINDAARQDARTGELTMNSTLLNTRLTEAQPAAFDQAVVATYRSHTDAEAAVRLLAAGGLPITHISIIGRQFETHEDIQGFYRPADAALAGAGTGAWFGGFFGLMVGAMGFFVFPVVGALMVMGPIAGLIAGAIGGAGVGALINGLIAAGVPRDQALKYQDRLQAGEYVVVVHGGAGESTRAHEILEGTAPTHLQAHVAATEGERTQSFSHAGL